MNNRVGIATLVVFLAGAPILALAVLTRPAPGTETATAEQPSVVAVEAATQTAARTAPAVADAVPLAPASAAAAAAAATSTARPPARRTVFVLGGTVTLHLQRTDSNGSPVSGGTQIDWEIVAVVSMGDNEGLALISVDLVQDVTNPAFFDIPVGVRPAGAGGMDKFDRPMGISNPDGSGGSAYGGTQIGAAGAMNLVQIGGAQNTFGETFAGALEDATIEEDVGQEPGGVGRVIATGSFPAPFPIGTYKFDLSDGVGNTLLDVNTPPAYSRVSAATVDILTNGSFSFVVQ